MAKLLKCRTCLLTNATKEEMECEENVSESGKITRMYFHKGECWEKRLAHKEFLRTENEQLDNLCETIKRVHGLEIIPNSFFSLCLQPVRNGNYRQGRKVIKYKKGVSYKMLDETYKYCEKSIEKIRSTKDFGGTLNELKYCFAVVIDKIPVVAKKIRQKQKLEEEWKRKEEMMKQSSILPERHVAYKPVEDDEDYSYLD